LLKHARPYLYAVQQLLACSERTQVPLIGFVDNSLSHDLIRLIETITEPTGPLEITDGGLLAKLLPHWGDRSPFFECAREDVLSKDGHAPFYSDVVFTYMHLASDRSPARST